MCCCVCTVVVLLMLVKSHAVPLSFVVSNMGCLHGARGKWYL